MKRRKKVSRAEYQKLKHEHPLPGQISPEQKEQNINAHNEAEKDITGDAEFTAHNVNDDLDEGESARLGNIEQETRNKE